MEIKVASTLLYDEIELKLVFFLLPHFLAAQCNRSNQYFPVAGNVTMFTITVEIQIS